MEDAIKPIKRSAALSPLSREHHQGLLAVWKIRQGIKKEVMPERIVAFVLWVWQEDLLPHFKKEETVLLPYLAGRADLKERMLQEHLAIADHVQVVEHNMYWETLENLAHALNDHIRWEERVLFGAIESSVSQNDLAQIGLQLSETKPEGVWNDAFWER